VNLDSPDGASVIRTFYSRRGRTVFFVSFLIETYRVI